MDILGYNISKKPQDTVEKNLNTFSSKESNDGTLEVEGGIDFAGQNRYILDLDAQFETEKQRIDAYRVAANTADLSVAIDDIVNESIVITGQDDVIDLTLDDVDLSDGVKKKVFEEFEYIMTLLDFNNKGDDIFKRWYIDGKIYYHKVVGKNEGDGLAELRYLDPRRIKKVRETVVTPNGAKPIGSKEYYVYSLADPDKKKQTIVYGDGKALEIHTDMVAYAHSGLIIDGTAQVDSYIQKSLKPLNQLMALEDSVVVYRVSRAPERRIFYIDVGNLPKTRAEGYIQSIIGKYKNKVTYDATTGSFTNNKNQMSMLEDIWLPRREGSRGTEVSTLPGGQSLGEMEDVNYFKQKLWKSLHLPMSRLDDSGGNTFNAGRATEISRDEIKFTKFVHKLQKQFGALILDSLKTQLILKKIITDKDWEKNKYNFKLRYNTDSYYSELKEMELLNDRVSAISEMDTYVGKYFSPQYVMKTILQMSDEDIKQMQEETAEAVKLGLIPDPAKKEEE